jgi:hypothetical protein
MVRHLTIKEVLQLLDSYFNSVLQKSLFTIRNCKKEAKTTPLLLDKSSFMGFIKRKQER